MENNIQTAVYITIWDTGFRLEQPCKVNTKTHEVFDIEYDEDTVNTLDTLEILQEEWVRVNGVTHKLITQDKLPFWYGENE